MCIPLQLQANLGNNSQCQGRECGGPLDRTSIMHGINDGLPEGGQGAGQPGGTPGAPSAPGAPAPPPPPDPAQLAVRARQAIPLVPPGFHMAPHDPQYDYVGLDTWLWTDPWQPQQATVTVRQTSVKLVAQPVRVWFEMGDGNGATCHDQGRPWVTGMTDAAKTDCAYVYQHVSQNEPGGKFTINAAFVYRLTWTCSGVCTKKAGDMGEADGNEAHARIRVDERQSVVTGGN